MSTLPELPGYNAPLPEPAYEKHQVVVVGAGPSGLFLALKIAQQGIDVLVVEAEKAIVRSPRAIAYMPIVLNEFEKVGIFDDLLKIGYRNEDGVQFRTPHFKGDHLLGNLRLHLIPKGTHMYDFVGINTGQDRLADIILSHAEKLPSFHVAWNHRYAGQSQTADEVTVMTVGPKGEAIFKAEYVIGADGAGSQVRRSLGIPFEGFTWDDFRFVATNVIYDFAKYGYGTGVMVIDDEDWAVIGRIEKEDVPGRGLWRVALGVRTSVPEDQILDQVAPKFEKLFPGPRPLQYELVSANPYWAHQRVARDFKRGRTLLIGDAAHANNPIGGLGLTTGLLDAAALGNCLIRIFCKNEPDPDALLERYAQVRKKAFVEFSNRQSIENKLRVSSNDPEVKKNRDTFLHKLNTDNEFTLQMARMMYQVMDDDFEN